MKSYKVVGWGLSRWSGDCPLLALIRVTCVYLLIYLFIHPSISIILYLSGVSMYWWDWVPQLRCDEDLDLKTEFSGGNMAWTNGMDPSTNGRLQNLSCFFLRESSCFISIHWNKTKYNNELLFAPNFRTINRMNFQHLGDVFWPFVTMLAPTGSARATKGRGSPFSKLSPFAVSAHGYTMLYQDHDLPKLEMWESPHGHWNMPPCFWECTPQSGQWFWRKEPQLAPRWGSEMHYFVKLASPFLSLITKQLLTPTNPVWIQSVLRCSIISILYASLQVKTCLLILGSLKHVPDTQ